MYNKLRLSREVLRLNSNHSHTTILASQSSMNKVSHISDSLFKLPICYTLKLNNFQVILIDTSKGNYHQIIYPQV